MREQESNTLWESLGEQKQKLADTPIEQLFRSDKGRIERLSLECNDILFDFTRHNLNAEAHALLIQLAGSCGMEDAIESMFRGEHVNTTEDRPALHAALRGHVPAELPGAAREVADCLTQMEAFVSAVHSGEWRGFNGDPIRDVVNIGIGGSDLGPAMVTEALRHYHRPTLRCHFVSNVDPCHLLDLLPALNPQSTLFIIASKSFTTLETMENARLARHWYQEQGGSGEEIWRHFVAATANVGKAVEFGIREENIFPLWDWVGGRYSLWSAIGLPIALAIGMTNFKALLQGGKTADTHFLRTPLAENIPVLMGLLSIWYARLWGARSQVILPYIQNLHLLPAFLQQLEMESLGKSVDIAGQPVDSSGLIIWGSAGTNGQHSFHQLLHQGTHCIPADFIAAARSPHPEAQAQHEQLLANCFSQSQALMQGTDPGDPHRRVPGNRPSSTFLMKELSPQTLGTLIAFYEHKVYVQSIIWGINAFDQWGVEIGKQLSGKLYPALQQQEPCTRFDPATNGLVNQYRQFLQQQ
jgi:glucose-6-phosphate isomerase